MLTPTEIRSLMTVLGLRPTELAARCGVTDDAVRKWLRGDNAPNCRATLALVELREEAKRAKLVVS